MIAIETVDQLLIKYTMNRESRKALSLQSLSRHQERVRNMIAKIEKYKPNFHINKNYKRYDIEKRIQQRQQESDKLFEQNMKLIYRIQTTGPKIQTKKFPEVKPNPRRLKALSTHSGSKSTSKTKFLVKDVYRNEQELFEQNMKLITNIECTGPKISCWTSKKVRNLTEMLKMKKLEEQRKILNKFKEISHEFSRITKMKSFRRNSSNSSLNNKSTLG